ncbi:MAG: hypothetical protein JO278_15950 [Dyella sp.]|nr:hypothetical protein [Dyella sp.]
MEAKYLTLLPGELHTVVAEIEHRSNSQIIVQPAHAQNVAEQGLASAVIDLNRGAWALMVNYVDDISPYTLTHELLHLKRALLEGVTRLTSRDQTPQTLIEDLITFENTMEHLWIIPEEQKFFPNESASHWNQDLSRNIGMLDSLNHHGQHRNILQLSAISQFAVRSQTHTDELRAWADKTGNANNVDHFLTDIRGAADNKTMLIQAWVRNMGFPSQLCQRARYDVDRGVEATSAL